MFVGEPVALFGRIRTHCNENHPSVVPCVEKGGRKRFLGILRAGYLLTLTSKFTLVAHPKNQRTRPDNGPVWRHQVRAKFMRYDIRQDDAPLIEAAIALGEWLQVQPDFPQSQLDALKLILSALCDLPSSPPPDLCGEFGFDLVSIAKPDHGHHGAWGVSFCRSWFEMYSAKSDEYDPEEFAWELRPGEQNRNSLSNDALWISEIANPRALIRDGLRISFKASATKVAL